MKLLKESLKGKRAFIFGASVYFKTSGLLPENITDRVVDILMQTGRFRLSQINLRSLNLY